MDEALDKTAQQDKKKELKYWIISKIFTKKPSILILLMVSSFIICNRTKILKNLNIKQLIQIDVLLQIFSVYLGICGFFF